MLGLELATVDMLNARKLHDATGRAFMTPTTAIIELIPWKENCNIMIEDSFHMSTRVGTNLEILHMNNPNTNCDYIILVNRKSGERFQMLFK
jgi:hypothetical protein